MRENPAHLAVIAPITRVLQAVRQDDTADTVQDVALFTQSSYVLRVRGDDGLTHYGVIRVEVLGFDQDGNALMIFDWAYQLQAGNPNLAPSRGG